MRNIWILFFALLTLDAKSKVALVIGNQNYNSHTQLKNAIHDAKLIKKTLEDLGFDVIESCNANINTLDQDIPLFKLYPIFVS